MLEKVLSEIKLAPLRPIAVCIASTICLVIAFFPQYFHYAGVHSNIFET